MLRAEVDRPDAAPSAESPAGEPAVVDAGVGEAGVGAVGAVGEVEVVFGEAGVAVAEVVVVEPVEADLTAGGDAARWWAPVSSGRVDVLPGLVAGAAGAVAAGAAEKSGLAAGIDSGRPIEPLMAPAPFLDVPVSDELVAMVPFPPSRVPKQQAQVRSLLPSVYYR